jgi:hypothetical protein
MIIAAVLVGVFVVTFLVHFTLQRLIAKASVSDSAQFAGIVAVALTVVAGISISFLTLV